MNQADFDAAVAAATSSTVIELPGGTINWPLNIARPCIIVGNNTLVNLQGAGLMVPAVNIAAGAYVSQLRARNDSSKIAVQVSGNGAGAELMQLYTENSGTGFLLHNAYGWVFTDCEAKANGVNWDLNGDSSTVGDIPGHAETQRLDRTHHNSFSGCLSRASTSIGLRFVNSDHNSFQTSKVYENSNTGIWQMPASYENKFQQGEVYGNAGYGLRNTDNVHPVDATGTWWGDPTGPSGGEANGFGQRITKFVSFDPWSRNGTEPDLPYPGTRDWIWAMLGSPLVRVELTEQQVSNAIEMALDRWMYYMTSEEDWAYGYVSKDAQELDLSTLQNKLGAPISMKKEQVKQIVYRPYADVMQQLSGSEGSFFLTYYLQRAGGVFLSDFYIAMSYKQDFETILGMTPTYEFISSLQPDGTSKDFVRVYPNPATSLRIGVKYSRPLTEAEADSERWIRMYALTYAKETLGRVRSKYGSMPSPTGETQLDGATLLGEAIEERQKLLEEVISRSEPLSFSIG